MRFGALELRNFAHSAIPTFLRSDIPKLRHFDAPALQGFDISAFRHSRSPAFPHSAAPESLRLPHPAAAILKRLCPNAPNIPKALGRFLPELPSFEPYSARAARSRSLAAAVRRCEPQYLPRGADAVSYASDFSSSAFRKFAISTIQNFGDSKFRIRFPGVSTFFARGGTKRRFALYLTVIMKRRVSTPFFSHGRL